MSEKDLKVIENIQKEISRIDKKENKIYFFVIDTKGVPSGSLEYIYNLALILKKSRFILMDFGQERRREILPLLNIYRTI